MAKNDKKEMKAETPLFSYRHFVVPPRSMTKFRSVCPKC